MKRVVIIAKGEVQRVGYRDEVERIARKLGLTGYVENLKPYDVMIVAEGDEERLKQFIELVKIQKFPIFVENLEVTWQEATGEFSFFEIRRGDWTEELFERLDAAGRLLYRNVELSEKAVELGEKNLKLSERAVELSERAVELGEKNLKLSEKAVALSERTVELGEKNLKLGRAILKAIREESEKTREEIRLLRGDLREYIQENLKEIRDRIVEIEKALKRAGIM
ncbi:acylphosphatase [Candidatus Korarchaeum cryptofilum]|uniref:acylphosphatase n=1 Tax=Candidatus Korarchaeum cryptofilum TaxID=498846 RepID=A0A3R9P966_9CREN|nr:acylphosphatase [Candidatus Korarchaeum cryptofilum]RSN67477.1 acylphosphatase [Candidatus Korarchaeum cryptofilum]